MNKKQEKALFGNVLPEYRNDFRDGYKLRECLKLDTEPTGYDFSPLLSLARSQRDAIGALIENVIDWFTVAKRERKIVDLSKEIKIILSAVQQNTWEAVREAWEENQ